MTGKEDPGRFNTLELLRQEYFDILSYYLPAELKAQSHTARVISVACGFAAELPSILGVLPGVHYEGIDINASQIRALQVAYGSLIPSEQFRVADATDPRALGPEPWDLVVIRNPQIQAYGGKMNPQWEKIFDNSQSKIRSGGHLFLTTHTPEEFETTLGYLQRNSDLVVVTRDRNIKVPITSTFPMKESSIAILQKPK